MEEFIQQMFNQLGGLEKNLELWKKLQAEKQVPMLDDLIIRQSDQLKKLRQQVQDFKIQIVFRGTMSSGKSTLINALMGSELLTSRNDESTKKYFIISHGDQIKINGQCFSEYKPAYDCLEKLQIQEGIQQERIFIESPSIFHENLSPLLRKIVQFIDCPGIKQGQEEDQMNAENDSGMICKNNPTIDVWTLNFTNFDDDKKRIYYLIEKQQKIEELKKQQKEQKYKIIQKSTRQQINVQDKQKKIKEKQLFVLNKWDEYKSSKDKNKDKFIIEIKQKVGDEHFIFRISAQRFLAYQIMTFGTEQAKTFFISNYFEDTKEDNKFKTEYECQEQLQIDVKNNSLYEFFDFLKSLKEQIELKVYAFQNSFNSSYCISQDYYLMMRLRYLVQHTIKKTPLIETTINDFQLAFEKILNEYNSDLIWRQKLNNSKIIILFLIAGKQKVKDEQLLLQCSQEVLKNLDEYQTDLKSLSSNYDSKVNKLILELKIDVNVISELNSIWKDIWTKFNVQQATLRKKNSFEEIKRNISEILGIEFIPQSLVSGWITAISGTAVSGTSVALATESIIMTGLTQASRILATWALGATGGILIFGGLGLVIWAYNRQKLQLKTKDKEMIKQNLQKLNVELMNHMINTLQQQEQDVYLTSNCFNSLIIQITN